MKKKATRSHDRGKAGSIGHSHAQQGLIIQPSTESFRSWIARPYIGEDLRLQLAKANVLIIPSEGFGDRSDLVYFPQGTEELLQFIRTSGHSELSVDICCEQRKYQELALHSALLIIGAFVVSGLVAPIVVNVVSDLIKRRLGSRDANANVRSQMIAHNERTGVSVSLSYEGPASAYRSDMLKALETLSKEPSLVAPPAHPQLPPVQLPPDTAKAKLDDHSR